MTESNVCIPYIICADKVEQIRWAIIISVVGFAYESTDMCAVCLYCMHKAKADVSFC